MIKRARTLVAAKTTPLPTTTSTTHAGLVKTSPIPTVTTAEVTPNDTDTGCYSGDVATTFRSSSSSLSLSSLPTKQKDDNLPILEICDTSSESSERSAVSEGFDDFHCTQICNDDYDDEDNGFDEAEENKNSRSNNNNNSHTTEFCHEVTVGNPLVFDNDNATDERHDEENLAGNSLINDNEALPNDTQLANTMLPAVAKAPAETTTTNPMDSENICFICGSSFARITSGLNGRLQHIKRCAKKYGVTARDIRINDDDDAFTTTNDAITAQPPKTVNNNADKDKKPAAVLNPYATKQKPADLKWDGDAGEDLKLASATSAPTPIYGKAPATAAAAAGVTKQTALTTFFKAPLRSLNNVLLASAKRVAKTAELNAQPRAPASSKQQAGPQGANGKRRRWGGARRDSVSPVVSFMTMPRILLNIIE